MLEVKRLLKFTPDEAIIMMANSNLNTQLRSEIVRVGEVIPLDGLRARVTVTSIDAQYDMIQNPYVGRHTLEYSRYDLAEVFGQLFIDVKLPTTVYNILDYITDRTGIVFDDNDFNNGVIEDTEFTLYAKSNSKRWVGGVKIILTDEEVGIHISQWLSTNRHDGLVTVAKEYIYDIYPKDILDGLEVGKPFIGILLRTTEHDGLITQGKPTISLYLKTYEHDGLVIEPYVPSEEDEVIEPPLEPNEESNEVDLDGWEL